MKKLLPFIIIFALLVVGMFFALSRDKSVYTGERTYSYGEAYGIIGGETLALEIVDTPRTRTLGLSHRPSIGKDEGMLFVFDTVGQYKFWMKDMNFSIDMIWLNENLEITYIANQVSPDSYPDDFGPNEKTSKYVLEVFSGFARKHDLEIGDTLELLP